jgi:hypothetical protein
MDRVLDLGLYGTKNSASGLDFHTGLACTRLSLTSNGGILMANVTSNVSNISEHFRFAEVVCMASVEQSSSVSAAFDEVPTRSYRPYIRFETLRPAKQLAGE